VTQTEPKKSVKVDLVRARKNMSLTLTIGQRPESADLGNETSAPVKKGEKESAKVWQGAHVAALTPELAESAQQPSDAAGVIVTDIDNDSQAEDMGLIPGDIIRSVNQEPTPDLASFMKATSRVKLSEGVVLDILRQGQPAYLSYTKP